MLSGMRGWLEQAVENPTQPTEMTSVTLYTEMITRLAADALPEIVQMAIQSYLSLILFGLILILLALVGPLFMRKRKSVRAEALP